LEYSSNKERDMSVVASADLRLYAANRWPLMNHKGRLRELGKYLTHWSARRVRAVYNAEPGVSLRADEQADIDQLIRAARHEHRELAQLAASLQALLFGPEADYYRPQVDAIRAALVPQSSSPARAGNQAGAGNRGRAGGDQ
jgi:hypothetical protein